jgi:hypothetical protein
MRLFLRDTEEGTGPSVFFSKTGAFVAGRLEFFCDVLGSQSLHLLPPSYRDSAGLENNQVASEVL